MISAPIINYITENLIKKDNINSNQFITKDTNKWDEWSEKKLAVMLYPNITRSMNESYECFGYTEDVLEWNPITRIFTRLAGTLAMTLANSKIKNKYNIINEREELNAMLIKDFIEDKNGLNNGNNKYINGNIITLSDIMVYGVLHSIEGLTAFNEIMNKDEPANKILKIWYQNVQNQVPSCEMIKAKA